MSSKLKLLLIALLVATTIMTSAQEGSTSINQSIRSIVLYRGWLYYVNLQGDVIFSERISNVRTVVFSDNHTGIDILDIQENNIRIYPNPAQNILHIESADVSKYQIFDSRGRLVLEGENNSIDVSALKTGTYLLLINNKTYKFIKQ